RLFRLTGLNLAIGSTLALALTSILSVSDHQPSAADLLLIWACTLAIAVFFSVHHLFMYYIFQPFTTDLNMKNPFYFVVTYVISFLCGISLFLHAPAVPFTVGIVCLALI